MSEHKKTTKNNNTFVNGGEKREKKQTRCLRLSGAAVWHNSAPTRSAADPRTCTFSKRGTRRFSVFFFVFVLFFKKKKHVDRQISTAQHATKTRADARRGDKQSAAACFWRERERRQKQKHGKLSKKKSWIVTYIC